MSGTLMQQPKLIPVQSVQAKPRWALDPSCVLYLPLWNISGDTFLSQDAYGHTVTRSGATATGQGGMSFDGVDDYLDTGNGASLNITEAITLGTWIKPVATEYGEIIDKGGAAGIAYKYYMEIDNELVTYLSLDGTWTRLESDIIVTTNQWSHLVLTYDRNNVKQYVNTLLGTVYPNVAAIDINTTNLTIGARADLFAGSWFNGIIGEVSIFNRALTALEIQNLYDLTRGRYGG